VEGHFPPEQELSEVSGGHLTRHERLVDGLFVNFMIWEVSGRERFRPMLPMYLQSATAVVFCFNPYDRFSVDHNRNIMSLVTQNVEENCLLRFVPLRSELSPDESQETSYQRTMAEMEAESALVQGKFRPVSAREGEGVRKLFFGLVDEKVTRSLRGMGEPDPRPTGDMSSIHIVSSYKKSLASFPPIREGEESPNE